jgi:sugar (pentulose or hexulose) kinase
VKIVLENIITAGKVNPEQIVGIGISYQMNGLVLLDEYLKPVRD